MLFCMCYLSAGCLVGYFKAVFGVFIGVAVMAAA